jgi:hypothetical protein
MVVTFNYNVTVPANYTSLNSKTFNITLIPTSSISSEYLNFTWEIVDFTKSGMKVQMNFSYPAEVSVR